MRKCSLLQAQRRAPGLQCPEGFEGGIVHPDGHRHTFSRAPLIVTEREAPRLLIARLQSVTEASPRDLKLLLGLCPLKHHLLAEEAAVTHGVELYIDLFRLGGLPGDIYRERTQRTSLRTKDARGNEATLTIYTIVDVGIGEARRIVDDGLLPCAILPVACGEEQGRTQVAELTITRIEEVKSHLPDIGERVAVLDGIVQLIASRGKGR